MVPQGQEVPKALSANFGRSVSMYFHCIETQSTAVVSSTARAKPPPTRYAEASSFSHDSVALAPRGWGAAASPRGEDACVEGEGGSGGGPAVAAGHSSTSKLSLQSLSVDATGEAGEYLGEDAGEDSGEGWKMATKPAEAGWLKALASKPGDQTAGPLGFGSRTNQASSQHTSAASQVVKSTKRRPDHSSPQGMCHVRPRSRSVRLLPIAPPRFRKAYCVAKANALMRRLVSFLMATMYRGSQMPSASGPRPTSTRRIMPTECEKTRTPRERTPRVVAVMATLRMPKQSIRKLPAKPQMACMRPQRP
mmetsp:Transcript_34217/g.102185  ORF Transcript_34217/g.102185 Transcript_34217/m.102185 type:complete len:307 (+) Transcript_34217:619-1539(+)